MPNTFPVLSNHQEYSDYNEKKSKDSVVVGNYASGCPLVGKLFTFDPTTWTFTITTVTQVYKESVMTFYAANKDIPFYWANELDSTTYTVIFVSEPDCNVIALNNIWSIGLVLRQYA